MKFDTMSTTNEDSEDLTDLQLPSNFESPDLEEEIALRDLELQMEIESSMYDDSSMDTNFAVSSPMEMMAIRSVIQLPGDLDNSTVWVQTKTGRRAKVILEAQDEQENVGLLEFEDETQEIRRFESYNDGKRGSPATPSLCKIPRVDTLTVPTGIVAARESSMRVGKNPGYNPLGSELPQPPSYVPVFPSF